MLKRVGIWAAVAAAWAIAWTAKEAFGIPDYVMWLSVVAVVGILISFNFESRLRDLETRVVHKDYSGILALLKGERHIPQHQQPESLAAGGAIASWIGSAHEVLFEDFRWFAAVMNQHLSDPWAIEELNDTSILGYDGPEIGRRYQVWYNACKVGNIQVTVGAGSLLKPDWTDEDRSARVEISLNYLRFIQYRDARALISEIALLTGPFNFKDGETSRHKAAAAAADALGGYLWEAVREPGFDLSFDYLVEGPYDLVRHQVAHWKKHEIDPMVKWRGDRERA